MPRNSTLLSNDTAAASPLTQGTTVTAVQANDRQATNCYFALSRVLRVHSDYLATGHTVADNFTECRTICDFLLLRESAVNLQRNNREGSSALETRFSERSAISVSK